MKKLTDSIAKKASNEIIMLLLASRDCYINQERYVDKFDARDSYYSEAFGVLRGLRILGFGYFGTNNLPAERDNLKWWFGELQEEALGIEEKLGLKEAFILYRNLVAKQHEKH